MAIERNIRGILLLLISLLPPILSIVDCTHGFVGRMQASLTDSFININDTRMCAADWCIKVLIHSAIDDDDTFQQGISSRCGYTGGDRQICALSSNKCTPIDFYDGMRGNFSFCCCKENSCNIPTESEILRLYGSSKKRVRSNSSSLLLHSLPFHLLLLFSLVQTKGISMFLQ